MMGFNSRTREGATCKVRIPAHERGFNSRTREGATSSDHELLDKLEFQFTHP